MFWRRRKLPEDEPLVPHGLISQAMEEEGSPELPPDMWDNSPEDVKQSPAEPVEMRLRVSAPVPSCHPEPLPEQGRISPPLKWPRVDEVEIARRAQGIDTAVSFPYRRPIVSAAIPNPDVFETEPEAAEPAKLELVEISPITDPVPAASTGKLRNLLLKLGDLRLPGVEPLRQRIHSAFSQARTTTSSGFQAAQNRLLQARLKSGVALDAARMRLVSRSQAAIAESRAGLQHVRENIRGTDLSGAGRAWKRVRSWQVTVRIPAFNKRYLSLAIESAKPSAILVQRIVQRDSRLWASMGMAALSALLALGFISAVRHYGPDRVEAQPTSRQVLSATVPAKAAPFNLVVPPKPSARVQPIAPPPSPITRSQETEQVAVASPTAVVREKKEASAPGTPKHRVHRTEEDDYVAKDTYVFYGNTGKPPR